ncbi:MAG: alanine racemase, partial [Gammaproteobacteria bacterium]|nr:alanine racemase [Gammaproteobacteria bacterium]
LVQVNTSGEGTKSGISPAEAPEAVHRITELPGLSVRGLMTMAPFTDREGVLRGGFRALRRLHEELGSLEGYHGEHLSMGMTNDFGIAIEEGSTMVRIGTALLGPRPRPPARQAGTVA